MEWINWLPLSVILVAWALSTALKGKAKEKADEVIKDMYRENEKNLTELRKTNELLREIIFLLKEKK